MENTQLPPKFLHYYLVADRSGSMSDQIDEVRDEINRSLQELTRSGRESNTRIRLHLLVFNNQLDWLYTGQDIEQFRPLTPREYSAGGNTALFDAAGQAIEWAANAVAVGGPLDPEKEEVVIMIFSDGMENSSCRYNPQSFSQLVERYQNEPGWTITFSGCDIQGILQMRSSNLRTDRMIRYQMHEKQRAMQEGNEILNENVRYRKRLYQMVYEKDFRLPEDEKKIDNL
jgi:hypothetical protein